MATSKMKGAIGGGCLVLFALPFAGIGVAAFGYVLYVFSQYNDMRGWVETPARILSADLNEHQGDDSTTYSFQAEFAYEVDGQRYTSEWVGLFTGSDNIGSWHEDRYEEVRPYLRSGEAFPCYVNPANPTEAILFRQLRFGMLAFLLLFAVLFGSVGFGLLIGGVMGAGKVKEIARRTEEHPGQPWEWNPDWSGGRVVSKTGASAYALLGFGVFWMLVSSPVVAFVPSHAMEEGEYAILWVLIFPVIGVLLLASAGHQIAKVRKYGTSILQIDGGTGVLGGRLSGVVQVPRELEAPDGVRVVLRCQRERTTGSGKNRSTSTNTLWQHEALVHAGAQPAGLTTGNTMLPVRFTLPYDLPPVDLEGDEKVRWVLALEAETPGLDYGAEFDVPVFKTPDSVEQPEDFAVAADVPETTLPLDPRIVRVEVFADGMLFTYPRTRYLFAGIFLLVFGAVFGGVVPVMLSGGVDWWFAGIFAAVALGTGISGLGMLLNQLQADVKRDGIHIVSSYILFSRRYFIPSADITEITPHSNMQVGGDAIYRILVKTRQEKEFVAGSAFRSQNMAQQVVALMTQALAG